MTVVFTYSNTLTLRDVIVYSSEASVIKILKKYNALKIHQFDDKYFLDPFYLIPFLSEHLEYGNGEIIIMSKTI